MPDIVAQFKFEDKFHLTSRGTVITGQIVSGEISTGNSINIEYNGNYIDIKITGVEAGHAPNHHFIGLILSKNDIIPEIELDKLKGTIFDIIP